MTQTHPSEMGSSGWHGQPCDVPGDTASPFQVQGQTSYGTDLVYVQEVAGVRFGAFVNGSFLTAHQEQVLIHLVEANGCTGTCIEMA